MSDLNFKRFIMATMSVPTTPTPLPTDVDERLSQKLSKIRDEHESIHQSRPSLSARRGVNCRLRPCLYDNKLLDFPKVSDPEQDISKILPFLWIGSRGNALDRALIMGEKPSIVSKKFGLIINVTPKPEHGGCPNKFEGEGIEYLRVALLDDSGQPISEHFDVTFKAIDKARAAGHYVLVHCEKGISRSSTIVMAYIMRALCIPFKDAFDIVKAARSFVSPNIDFIGQLLRFQKTLTLRPTAEDDEFIPRRSNAESE